MQKDIFCITCNMILRKTIKGVNDQFINFGIVADGTKDIQVKEQQPICVCFGPDLFEIEED